ncbi:ribbon-helix-helix domain-containing protein [Ferrovum sp. PN-J185]
MKRSNIFLPLQFLDRLRALADKTGITMSEHIRRAVEEYLKRKEREK